MTGLCRHGDGHSSCRAHLPGPSQHAAWRGQGWQGLSDKQVSRGPSTPHRRPKMDGVLCESAGEGGRISSTSAGQT